MDFLIRFVQIHETFRKPEIEALAVLANVNLEFLLYTESVRLDVLSPNFTSLGAHLKKSFSDWSSLHTQ